MISLRSWSLSARYLLRVIVYFAIYLLRWIKATGPRNTAFRMDPAMKAARAVGKRIELALV
jgi:hypothetical protein